MYSYELIDGGYLVKMGPIVVIRQPHSPNQGLDVRLSPEVAERLAKLVTAKLELRTIPLVTMEEEVRLLTPATDEEIRAMALAFAESQSVQA